MALKVREPVPQSQSIPDAMNQPSMGGQPGMAVEEKFQPAPTTIYKPTESAAPLVDIPCFYLHDRTAWPEFKRTLNECGLTLSSSYYYI